MSASMFSSPTPPSTSIKASSGRVKVALRRGHCRTRLPSASAGLSLRRCTGAAVTRAEAAEAPSHPSGASPDAAQPPSSPATPANPAKPAAGDVAKPEAETAGFSETFNWLKHWYPIQVAANLDPSRPHHAQLLGSDLVLWRDGKGEWKCFEDICPHRMVPLSEGRVEANGELMCAYHAWTFDSSGTCTNIPQAETPVTEWKEKQRAPCNATAYPTKEAAGLIWVWPQTGAAAAEEAENTPMRGFQELWDDVAVADGKVVHTAWSLRDLPYGWDYFIENVVDPAHVPVSHHNIVGNRYKDAKFFNLEEIRPLTAKDGFEFKLDRTTVDMEADRSLEASHDFQPPCLVRIRNDLQSGAQTNLCLFVVPTVPGKCRSIGCQVLVKNNEGKLPAGLSFFSMPMPDWLVHILAPVFLHMDSVFLHHQEKIVHKRVDSSGKSMVEECSMPTPSDKMVILFRKWLSSMAGGIPWAPGAPPLPEPEHDSAKLFDTYQAHTKHCSSCLGALKGVKFWQTITAAAATCFAALGGVLYAAYCSSKAAIAAATAASLRKGKGAALEAIPMFYSPPAITWCLLALALVALAAHLVLRKLHSLFYKYEFSHADNN
mmetsp:Transcript_15433/g.43181  ORF Transcript_15433/g.43181 Transcript_15433/m.43181 type:complete len:602 (-) Transcript_15433:300-2105(-)|eukprot:CAMPEP_0117665486 /NCGR_PEP_ID=MMETSP0804-20121206/9836_1 /TAXON_ID=1074897 /ORGANISM="Tetraselmis astigmatica, Strain CCMP880" /LENGTH=601 /DNA_ID=CAMNT_0005472903 /DNA_START=136 /DNA_END=1941 /DNA_ORIENTATION=+